MSHIDLLLEKWLTGFKQYGKLVDVFQDPDRKDLSEFAGQWRFIADSRDKTVYAWPAMGALHSDSWQKIKAETGKVTVLYKHPSLLPGTVDKGVVHIHAAEYMSFGIRKGIKETDWSFLFKYLSTKETDFLKDELNRL